MSLKQNDTIQTVQNAMQILSLFKTDKPGMVAYVYMWFSIMKRLRRGEA